MKSASDISGYLLSIRNKHFMHKGDSLLNKAYEILGYESADQVFNQSVSLAKFVKVILNLQLNERREKSAYTPPQYSNQRRSRFSG